MRDATSYARPELAHLPEAEWAPRQLWVANVPIEQVLDNGTAPKAAAVLVYANHGRWIAECPDCRGAQFASKVDRRFMCNNCANAAVGHLWRLLVWPKDHGAIGELLDARPAHLANAWPGETAADIRKENRLLEEATMLGGDDA